MHDLIKGRGTAVETGRYRNTQARLRVKRMVGGEPESLRGTSIEEGHPFLGIQHADCEKSHQRSRIYLSAESGIVSITGQSSIALPKRWGGMAEGSAEIATVLANREPRQRVQR